LIHNEFIEIERKNEMSYLNLTPHAIRIIQATTGAETVIEPSGTVARCSTTSEIVGTCPLTGVPIVRKVFGEVTGLPTDGTPCLVSIVVLGACAGMLGVFAPDTSPESVVRDAKGLVYGVKALVAA
jgi:hypothetical protein